MLKLDAFVTPNSGWKDVSSRYGKMVFLRVHGHAHLYVSPFAKAGFINEFGISYKPSHISSVKTLLWKSLDILDTIITRGLQKVKSWFKKSKSVKHIPSPEHPFSYAFTPSMEENEFMEHRKKTIKNIMKGKKANRMETLNTSHFSGKMPTELLSRMLRSMDSMDGNTQNNDYGTYRSIDLDPKNYDSNES